MADADSDGDETTFSEQKSSSKEAVKAKRKGKNTMEAKESHRKGGMSKPGRAVVVSGGSTRPPLGDTPVNMSPDENDLVMEYSDMFEPSQGVIDIQEDDAISESSDTEVVAYTNEHQEYDDQAAESASNSDSDAGEGPPPFEEDDDDGSDGDNIDGPPPLDTDEEDSGEEHEQLSSTSPEKGSMEDLRNRKVQMEREKSSEDSGSESDSEGVREAPPPLDSDGDDGNQSDSNMDNIRGEDIETVIGGSQDSPAENTDNDDGDNDNDNDDAKEDDDDSDEEYVPAEAETPEAVALVTEHSDGSENGDEAVESDSQQPPNQSADANEDDVSDEKDSDEETAAALTEVEADASVAVSSASYNDEEAVTDPHENEVPEVEQETNLNGDEHSEEEIEEEVVALTHSEQNPPASPANEEITDKGSDHDSSESPEFVPQEEDDELEWDVEDFDIPKRATPKIDPEKAEVDNLKRSFLDTLKSEAEQSESISSQGIVHKAAVRSKEKVIMDSNKRNPPKTEKKPVKDNVKSAPNKELVNETEKMSRKVTKDVHKTEPVKTAKREKKQHVDSVKNVSKNSEKPKVVDSGSKLVEEKVKHAEKIKTVHKTEKHNVEKQSRDVKEVQKTAELQNVAKKAASKSSKVKPPTAKSAPVSVHLLKTTQASSAKEKKKIRPISEPLAEVSSHKGQKDAGDGSHAKREVKKRQKSDSDMTSDVATKHKPQKTSSSESISRPKSAAGAVAATVHREKPKAAVENGEVKKSKSKRSSTKSVAIGTDSDNDSRKSSKKSDLLREHFDEAQSKPRGRPASNGHVSSAHSRDKLSSQHDRHGHGVKEGEHHRHDGHRHDRGKHVWLCRDDEIHKLIAQKASLLKEYETGSLAGRKVFAGHKSPYKSEENPADLPDVSFISSKQTKRQTRPLSEALPERAPYSARRKEQRRSLQLNYSGSSSDDDDRTNRHASPTKGGTFAVGLASRNTEHKEGAGESDSEHEETCEYCAAEKMSWDEYVKNCREAVSQRQEHDYCTLPLQLLQTFHLPPGPFLDPAASKARERNTAWEGPHHPRNLLLGVVYTGKYLGSSQIMSPQAPNKAVRMEQAQEAVGRIKVPEGEDQPTTDVDLFISTERIKIVNALTKEVMLDHALRTVSFIADIGDVLVLMARQPPEEQTNQEVVKPTQILASVGTAQTDHKNIKITCHVFQAPEAQVIAKSIGQAFNVAYQEFLRQNGLSEDVVEDAEYNGVLEAQKILGEDLSLLADETQAKEVIVNKKPAEILGIMIVESGWGSMIPCAIVAHLAKEGPAAKSGRLNVGDQILSVNGTSLVGLPLTECQTIIKSIRPLTKVVMKIVSCPPTVQVVVNRPDTKYQLGFSVQNGMICSLMRGSIAERGGVRVGHRIIEINGESVVATSHQHIVELLATTVGEIRMKTMPASMYRLLVGLEVPQHI